MPADALLDQRDPTKVLAPPGPDSPTRPPRPGWRQRWSRNPGWLRDTGVSALYLLGAIVLTIRMWTSPAHSYLKYTIADQTGYEWVIAEVTRLITHGQNPFFTSMLNAPDGVNLMAQTSVMGLIVPLIPVTLVAGPEATFVAMLIISLAGTAAAWYWLFVRHLGCSRPAALVAGAFCGFAPPMMSHAAGGHINYIALFLMPFIVWRVIRLREPGRWLRNGLLLGLLVAYQIFLGEEPLLVGALGIAVFLIVYLALRPAALRASWRPFLAGTAVAAGVTVVLVAYPLWWQFFGPQSYRSIPHAQDNRNDLLSLGSFASQSLGGRYPVGKLAMNPTEENGFLGWPVLALSVLAAIWMWRESLLARAATITAGVCLLLSMGTEIVIKGWHTGVPGPWKLLNYLPLVGDILPSRLTFAAVPAIALLLALATTRALATRDRDVRDGGQIRLLWVGALIAALLPITPTLVDANFRQSPPAFFTAGTWQRYVQPGGTILSVPQSDGAHVTPMRWTTVTGPRIALVEGYFIGPHGDDRHGWYGAERRPTAHLLDVVWRTGKIPPIDTTEIRQAEADLKYWGVQAIVLADGTRHRTQLYHTVSMLLGGAEPEVVDGVMVWRFPAHLPRPVPPLVPRPGSTPSGAPPGLPFSPPASPR